MAGRAKKKPAPEPATFQDENTTDKPKEKKVAAERVKIIPAPESVEAFCRRVMKDHHEDLDDAGVTLAVNWADAGRNSTGDKPALKVAGQPVVATIRKASEKETAQEVADITITIDMNRWKTITDPEEQKAAIDAVLCQVEVRKEGNTADGDVLMDANDRPKLRLVKPDISVVGFKANLERFGKTSPPAQALVKFKEENGQLLMFAFGNGESD